MNLEHTFTPKLCEPGKDGKPAGYAGTVTMRMPTYDERLELIDLEDVLDDDTGKPADAKKKNVTLWRALLKAAPKFFLKADLKRLDDGFVFTSWLEITHDSEVSSALVPEIATKLVGKFRVGNDSRSS